MKHLHCVFFIFLLSFGLLSQNGLAQLKIERKIIIEKELFYFFTIDEETQLATMHTGSIYEKLSKAKTYPMPIGRELNDPFNPLSFDINNGELIAINWILNSNNSRYEAIKKIDLKNWTKPHPDWTMENWAQASFDQPLLVPNEPWQQMLKANNVLKNCFFDLTQIEEKMMAICNQGLLRIWMSAGGKWVDSSAAIPVDFDGYFSLASVKDEPVCLIDSKGNVYKVNNSQTAITKVKTSAETKDQILIIDNDNYKTYAIAAESIASMATMNSLKTIIKSATEITF